MVVLSPATMTESLLLGYSLARGRNSKSGKVDTTWTRKGATLAENDVLEAFAAVKGNGSLH